MLTNFFIGFSQSVAINTTGAAADASSALDIQSTTKGFLVPRMTLTDRNAIASPATGLLIYQTNSTPGFYYYDGSAWVQGIGATGPAGAAGATGPAGPAGAAGSTGPAGPSGATGATGAAGADGKTVLNGTIAPTAGTGVNGDFYINTATNTIYGPKAGGSWPAGVSLVGPQGTAGAAGTNGSNGTNGTNGAAGADGKTVLNGTSAPSSGIGTDGDFYINTASNTLYGPKASGSWPSGVSLVGPQGTAGSAGTNGSNGTNGLNGAAGADGKTVLNGTSAPGSVIGTDGDFYINTASNTLYGPKVSGSWPSGVSLVGPQGTAGSAGTNGSNGTNGANGAAGADGKTVLNGTSAPSSVIGTDGDFYINTATNTLFGPKASGSWPTGVSLVGPQGTAGAAGAAGAAGTNGSNGTNGLNGAAGADGKTVLNGTSAPGSGIGTDGDFYINTATNTLYGPKAGGSWPTGVSLVGPQGTAGTNGTNGTNGSVSSVGVSMPSGFTVTNSPVTTSGTIAVTTTLNGPLRGNGSGITTGNTNLASEVTGILPIANGGTGAATTSQNFVFAGPTSGAGAPSFRALTAADIPDISGTYIKNQTSQQASSNFNITGTGTLSSATLTGTSNVLNFENGANFTGKNSVGTSEFFLTPRGGDNVTYLNYGSAGFNIRNSASTTSMFINNAGQVIIGYGEGGGSPAGNTLRASNAGSGNTAGGALNVNGGSAWGSGAGGSVFINGGTTGSGTNGNVYARGGNSNGGFGAVYLNDQGGQTFIGNNTATATHYGTNNFPSLTASAPVFTDASKNLTSSGTIGVGNGGTGTATTFTQGSVVFAGASGVYSQNNANFFWDNTNSRLGLGTTTPTQLLTMGSSTNSTTIRLSQRTPNSGGTTIFNVLGNDPTSGPYLSWSNTLPLRFSSATDDGGTGWTERMRIDGSTGNVGIGTTSPGNKLTLQTSTTNDGFLTTDGTRWLRTMPGTVGAGSYNSIVSANDNAIIYSNGTIGQGSLVIAPWANATSGIKMDASGNVGIGLVTPSKTLDVSGRVAIFSGRNSDPTMRGIGTSSWTRIGANGGGLALWGNNNVETDDVPAMLINSSQNVGIGTNSPSSKLHVSGGSARISGTTNTNAETGGMLIYDNESGLGGGSTKKVERTTYITNMYNTNTTTGRIFDDQYLTLLVYGNNAGNAYLNLAPKTGFTGNYTIDRVGTYGGNGYGIVAANTAGNFVQCSPDLRWNSNAEQWIISRTNLTNQAVYLITTFRIGNTSSGGTDPCFINVQAYYP